MVHASADEGLYQRTMNTPAGELRVMTNGHALLEISFHPGELNRLSASPGPGPAVLIHAIEQLQDYFHGSLRNFNLPLEPRGTPFQLRVWEELRGIPYGSTISYLDLAKRLGDPKCIRAAASANGKNPMAIVIPCHRVVGSQGQLTGYAGGLPRKKYLLDLECEHTGGRLTLF